MKFNQTERDAYAAIMKLAFPIMIQNLFSAAISAADVVMLNTVGQSAISAVSLAVQYTNVLFMVYYGLGTGATMLCAQYWGKGDIKAIEKVEGIALRFSLAISLLFALPALFVPELMMKVFTNDAELISLGADYLRIISVSYLCWSISEIYLAVLRSVERVKTSTVLNVSALLLNIFCNCSEPRSDSMTNCCAKQRIEKFFSALNCCYFVDKNNDFICRYYPCG